MSLLSLSTDLVALAQLPARVTELEGQVSALQGILRRQQALLDELRGPPPAVEVEPNPPAVDPRDLRSDVVPLRATSFDQQLWPHSMNNWPPPEPYWPIYEPWVQEGIHGLLCSLLPGRPIYSQMRHRATDGRLLTIGLGNGYMLDGEPTPQDRPRWVKLASGVDRLVGLPGEANHEAGWSGRYAVVGADSISVMEYDADLMVHRVFVTDQLRQQVQWCTVTRDGAYLVAQLSEPSRLVRWHIASGSSLEIWTGHARHCDVGESSDGRPVVYVEGRPTPDLVEHDIETGERRTLVEGLPWGRLWHVSAQGPAGYVLCSANTRRDVSEALCGELWIASDRHPDRVVHLVHHRWEHRLGPGAYAAQQDDGRYWTYPMATWAVVKETDVRVAWGTDLGDASRSFGHGYEVHFSLDELEAAWR